MRIILIVLTVALLSSCASKSKKNEDANASELQKYNAAQRSLRAGNYQSAVSKLQELEARFPFGRYAEQAQLEIIYAYYKSAQPEAARAAADRFIRLHPQHPNVDYAYYLKGMASFDASENFLEKFLPLDPSSRDTTEAQQAFNDFTQLVRRYPSSKYAPDAQQRMIYLRNLMARHEIHVARYYIQRGAYVAAANRGRYVFEKFQGTPSVPEALAVMVEAYKMMHMDNLADETLLVLATNFPNYKALDKNGNFKMNKSIKNSERSWINILTFGLIG
ncbi:MAG TPA: outer membrane protein assembly factor BamD [Pseudomonadales bacterium]|nr:outer membrane protein assembly factor BamD [Pseudomonadales bacterium]